MKKKTSYKRYLLVLLTLIISAAVLIFRKDDIKFSYTDGSVLCSAALKGHF